MADVLLHQQSFDYALSRAATEVIDWYPSPTSSASSSSPSSSAQPAASYRSNGGRHTAATATDNNTINQHNAHNTHNSKLGGGGGGGSNGNTMMAAIRARVANSAAAALFRQLPTWHLFISSLGSDTVAETTVRGRAVALRYGIYGSVLTSSRGYEPTASSVWERMRPVLQLRLSARYLDGSKGIGCRVTFQDVKSVAALDMMVSFGRRVLFSSLPFGQRRSGGDASPPSAVGDASPMVRTQNTFSHFLRFDRQLLTNYTIVNVVDRPDAKLIRKGRVGVGLVLRTKPVGVNIFWGMCIEVLKTLVLLVHMDVLRRACISIKSSNVFDSGVDVAMRLRINVITFHRTIMDVGVSYPTALWDGVRWCWRASINLGGLSVGGSLEECSLGELMTRSGAWLEAAHKPAWMQRAWSSTAAYCADVPVLGHMSRFSLPQFLLAHGKDETLQSVRVHITGGINVRHPNLSNYTNPFSASQLYYNYSNSGSGVADGKEGPSPHLGGLFSGGFFDAMKKPSSMHGFFSVTFS